MVSRLQAKTSQIGHLLSNLQKFNVIKDKDFNPTITSPTTATTPTSATTNNIATKNSSATTNNE